MNTIERRAVLSLASIMALRMIGLFMVVPTFSLYAVSLPGATPFLIGIAIGIYGLSQAFFQVPFGFFSDRFGRKPIIFAGLCLFALGSFAAFMAHNIFFMIFGRLLQGAGAVGSTILALISDLTREEQRTKSMAIAGMTIGLSFAIAMVLGPILTQWFSFNDLFLISCGLSFAAMFLLYSVVPTPVVAQTLHRASEWRAFSELIKDKNLSKLNMGIFILHALFTASFVAIPIQLLNFLHLPANQQWRFYLPALCIGFFFSIVCIGFAERKKQVKFYFLTGIIALIVAEFLFLLKPNQPNYIMLGLTAFFAGFSLLEAFLPSLISRMAPAARKGAAMGIYSCSQFLGIFVGGLFGGWLYGRFSFSGIYLFSICIASFWLCLAYFMQPPRYFITKICKLIPDQKANWEKLVMQLKVIPGMHEVTFVPDDAVIYLKMERNTEIHPDFIRFKEELQSN